MFFVKDTPPTQAEIDERRRTVTTAYDKKWHIILALTVSVGWVMFYLSLQSALALLIVYSIPLAVTLGMAMGNRNELKLFEPLTTQPDSRVEAIRSVTPHSAAYHQAILDQGRPFVVGDLVALQEEARSTLKL